jgi:uncharacterized protein YggE
MKRVPLIAGLAIALLAAAPAAAQTQPVDTTPTVSADGLGIATLAPDLATFQAYVTSTQKTSARARSVANGHVNAILKAASAAGVAKEDLLTERVSINRVSVKVHGKRRPRFRAEQVLQITVRRIAALSGLLAAVADTGANVDGPDFGFADPTQGRLLATRAALADARKRADDAAAQQGLRITGVRSIVLDPGSDTGDGNSGGSSDSAAAVPTSGGRVEAGTQRFVEQVRVIYTAAAL